MFRDEKIMKIIKRTIALSLVISGILLVVVKESKAEVLGLFFGSSIGVLTFILMGFSAKKAVQMDPKKAYGHAMRNYFIRYFIYFIVLTVSALADYLSLVTTALGLFMIKIIILSTTIYDSIKRRHSKKIKKN